jgi:cell division protein ZapA
MTKDSGQIDVDVELSAGKVFTVKCPKNKIKVLQTTIELVKQKMAEIKQSQKVISTERIALMTALNLAYELIESKSVYDEKEAYLQEFVKRVEAKVADS